MNIFIKQFYFVFLLEALNYLLFIFWYTHTYTNTQQLMTNHKWRKKHARNKYDNFTLN